MSNPIVQNSRDRALITGAQEVRKPGQPATLAEYVANLARANSRGIFTEIGFEGSEHSRSYGELFDDASRIAHTLKAIPSPGGECVLLCFESVIEHVAAAWACLLTGRSFLPLAISPFAHNRDKFLQHVREMAGALCASLVLTEARFRGCLSD